MVSLRLFCHDSDPYSLILGCVNPSSAEGKYIRKSLFPRPRGGKVDLQLHKYMLQITDKREWADKDCRGSGRKEGRARGAVVLKEEEGLGREGG